MTLEHLEGHQPCPDDLPVVAAALGGLHTVANVRYLHAGRLDRPFEATPTLTIVDFTSIRATTLPQDFELILQRMLRAVALDPHRSKIRTPTT
ncbi:hypothetical protein ACFZC5_30965 [Nocardia gamkensis]|uniref:hypothetical protein n=1 Tax=Nocardia gamkensis TaxID=352869 RepID=UPI0036ED69D2